MKTTTIRLEEVMLLQLQDLAKQMGISFRTLAHAALTKVLVERKIELTAPYTLHPEYERELESDPDTQKTVFIAKKPGESRKFLSSLMNN